MKIEIFEQINIRVPKEKIYFRLGYAKGKTQLSKDDLNSLESYLDFALDNIELKGVAAILAIKKREKGKISLGNDFLIKSKSLGEFLREANQVLFLGATAGSEIVKVISQKNNEQGLSRAVVADAAASEMVDAALGWIIDYQTRFLRRQNKILSRQRFSAGYGDFNLEYQKMIYNILQMKKIGVKLRSTYVLEPGKSVTAVCGIG